MFARVRERSPLIGANGSTWLDTADLSRLQRLSRSWSSSGTDDTCGVRGDLFARARFVVAPKRADRCDTGATLCVVPTRHRRHAITETPPVKAALDELRDEVGSDSVPLGELVILGAREKLAQLRGQRDQQIALRHRLADRVRSGEVPVDPAMADEVRRSGWARS